MVGGKLIWNMKRPKPAGPAAAFGFFLMVISVLLLSNIPCAAGENTFDGSEKPGGPIAYEKGDFFDYELDITRMITTIMEEESSDAATYEDVSSSYMTTIEGVEEISIGDRTVRTYVARQDMTMKFTIIDDEMGVMSTMELDSSGKEWINTATLRPVHSEETSTSTITIVYLDDVPSSTSVIETETIEVKSYSSIDETCPFPLEGGKKWESLESYISEITERSRYRYEDEPFSEWEEMNYEEESTETISFKILPEEEMTTPAGNFRSFGLIEAVYGSSDHDDKFMDRYGMVVRKDVYEDGQLVLGMKLRDWKFQNTKDTDGDDVIDGMDDFPLDKAASVDGDHDGYPDAWNEGMTEIDSSSDLKLDEYPNDPQRWEKDKEKNDGTSFAALIFFAVGGVLLTMLIVLSLVRFLKRRSVQ